MDLFEAIIFRDLLKEYLREFCKQENCNWSGADIVQEIAIAYDSARKTICEDLSSREEYRDAREMLAEARELFYTAMQQGS